MNETQLRAELVKTMRLMSERGLNRGTSGNAAVRLGTEYLVTPSGITPDLLTSESMVRIKANGETAGSFAPSSEWRMHVGILERRADVRAVVHCHSRFATTLACAGKAIPSMHYMVAVSGGPHVPLAPYHPFGSAELAEAVVTALAGGAACLMANHGQIAAAMSLARALAIAEEIEEQAAVYFGTLAIGGAQLLSREQMDDVLERFRSYGQKQSGESL